MSPTPPSATSGLVLLSHGSKDPSWRHSAEQLLALVRAAHPNAAVDSAYLDWCEPNLADVLQRLHQQHPALGHITIWPLLFGVGKHARDDIPALVEQLAPLYPHTRLQIAPAMGEDARVMQLLASMASGYLGHN